MILRGVKLRRLLKITSFPVFAALALAGCTDDGAGGTNNTGSGGAAANDHDDSAAAAGQGGAEPQTEDAGTAGTLNTADGAIAVTYWHDIAPIFAEHCVSCHQEGGIAPFTLDTYEAAFATKGAIRDVVRLNYMPPWLATDDGSCGSFRDSLTLNEEEKALVALWVQGGAIEGEPEPIEQQQALMLAGATEYSTPEFIPEVQGGVLAESDEYRCFLLDPEMTAESFITGYQVVPGNKQLVHHVLMTVVDMDGASAEPGLTNAALIQALDEESPERLGWPCFSAAGDGVEPKSVPVTWAPGQGVVNYPGASGVVVKPNDRFVVQVHYNMSNERLIGQSDSTTLRLQFDDAVENVGLFILNDPFLDSVGSAAPESLAPGESSVKYTWKQSLASMGLDGVPSIEFWGIMPHMHGLGQKYRATIDPEGANTCAVDVERWDFSWQLMYFYKEAMTLSSSSVFEVTCDYNTMGRKEPVLPGWGTRNEMCLATLYFTVPVAFVDLL